MLSESTCWPRRTAPIILGIVLAVVGATRAEPAKPVSRGGPGDETLPKDKSSAPKLSVGDCLRLAYEKQPKLAAIRASLGSAQVSANALQNARLIAQIGCDFKYRKQQAVNGALAAQADLDQSTHDVTQAVIWTYYSVVYAREQIKVTKEAVEFVDYYRDQVEKIVNDKKGGNKEINQITLNRLIARLAEGERLMVRALAGHEKAKAALREAMGVDHTYAFEVAEDLLPEFAKIDIDKEAVIQLAQTRRGEVIMAGLAADVTRLEAYIQRSLWFRLRVFTFASAGDIHSKPIPSGSKDTEYRPDAVGPEMPVELFGNRQTRTQKAWELVARSEAVQEKVRNLVTLEAENAYIDYFYAGRSMEKAKKQADAGNKNLMILKDVAGDKVSSAATLTQLLEAQGEAAAGNAAYNEAVYQRIAALANIERISGGGIKINYAGR